MKARGRFVLLVMLGMLAAGFLAAQESKPLTITNAVLIDGNGKTPI